MNHLILTIYVVRPRLFRRVCRSVEVAPTVWERRPLSLQELRVALPIAYVHRPVSIRSLPS